MCMCVWKAFIPPSIMGKQIAWNQGRAWENTETASPWGSQHLHSVQRGKGNLEAQNDSSCPTERSPLGVEARDEPLSMLSEPELWCCCSEPALEVTVEEEVEEERVFSLKSVMITVTFPTVMASCWAVLRSTFFSLGLEMWEFLVLVVDFPDCMLFLSLGGLWWLSVLGLFFLLLGFLVIAGVISFSRSFFSFSGWSFSIFSLFGVSLSDAFRSGRSPSTLSFSGLSGFSFFSFFGGGGVAYCWATCWATSWEFILGFLVDVPFRTSQMLHLKASALFLKVQTLQSQNPSSAVGLACLFGLVGLFLSPMVEKTQRRVSETRVKPEALTSEQ